MLRTVAFCLGLTLALPTAWADPVADCNQDQDRARCIKGCTQYIRQSRDREGLAAAHHNRGVAYMHSGELDQAIADYNKVIEFSPNYGDAYYNRGIAYRAKGDTDRAIADYTKAIENNPRDVDAHRNRGDAYRQQGRFRSRHCGLQHGNWVQSERHHALQQPRPGLREQRRLRLCHCGRKQVGDTGSDNVGHASDNQTSGCQVSGNKGSGNQASGNQASGNQTSDNQASDNQASDDQASDNQVSDNQARAIKSKAYYEGRRAVSSVRE